MPAALSRHHGICPVIGSHPRTVACKLRHPDA